MNSTESDFMNEPKTNKRKQLTHINNTAMSVITIKSDLSATRPKRRKNIATSVSAVSLIGADGKVSSRHHTEEPACKPQPSKGKTKTGSSVAGGGGVDKGGPGDGGKEGGHGGNDDKAITIDVSELKTIKLNIVRHWKAYVDCPSKIVKIIRRLYPNTGTASSQFSNLKSALRTEGAPHEFLAKLRLSRKEYRGLHDSYREKHDKEGTNLRTIHDSDKLVQSALQMITSVISESSGLQR
jgi:hypothetical protein